MKIFITVIFLASFLLAACSAATGIEISKTWTRPALQDRNGAVYFLLQNHSVISDELTGVSSEAARAVEMHESKMEGDGMQMRQLPSVPIRGKESIKFEPGSYHLMLVGLNRELQVGDEIHITLHFKNHEDLQVTVPVQEMAPGSEMGDH
jgi:periplasmic copper chaperone A